MEKTPKLRKSILLLVAAGCLASSVSAQSRRQGTTPAADTAKPRPVVVPPAPPKPGPKPFKDVVTDKATSRKGLFGVHKVEDKWYLEVNDSLLGRDVLVVNRISKAPIDTRAGFFGYAGDEINENVIRFEKGPNNKVFLRNISFSVYAKDSTKPMYKTVQNSNIQPISAAFDIKAFSKDSTGSLIDITDFISGDNDIFFFASYFKTALRIGGMQPDKSYIVDIKTYPINTEIKTVKTYSKMAAPSPIPGMMPSGPTGNATFELNTSIVLLPKVAMRPRFYDDRVAYFTTEYTDFDADPQGVKDISMITRWKLEVKPGDIEKFKRGELVEPVKPIIYYIDPATPAKWVPYLIQGVNDWQKAFEKAGFKNAIMAKTAPTKAEDSTWSLEDARYSAIVYKPSDIPNASGPHVHDPRSGEIIESHINWYHNVMRLLRNWYLIQASPSDPNARKAEFSDELMGQLIRFVSSHEVGHTLGLPHNMGSSAGTPVEKLRDKTWVEANGHTSSIMDYARFNYVAQPEDKIGPAGMYPRIGDYDLYSIEWGYRPILDKDEDGEKAVLNDWVKAKYNDPRFRFIHQNGIDPRAQTEALGDNMMKANEYGIKNLKWMLPKLASWLNEPGENYQNLDEVYSELLGQFNRYYGHVATYIGGIYTDYKTTEQTGEVYTVVPKALQKEAMAFITKNYLETPTWLLGKNILNKISSPTTDRISTMQDSYLGVLINASRMQRLVSSSNRDASAYRLDEYMEDLKKAVWSELATRKPIDNYRRNLQKSYVERLGAIVNPPAQGGSLGGFVISFGPVADPKKSDVMSVAKGILRQLKAEIAAAAPAYGDKMSRYHLQDLNDRISKILDPK
ncbi:zinc-dependent metalloprotease [Paraflavitalea pollutisoli]|uniref:zinc-dependent metalloprotease n=1 Tax=Paraflavitalea pollutisoli TaxID=3034143 RepID=UPI0023EB977F|nr:zinc-dependent metalloprotease [Paraflavitalea sp. H1-2-19X]